MQYPLATNTVSNMVAIMKKASGALNHNKIIFIPAPIIVLEISVFTTYLFFTIEVK